MNWLIKLLGGYTQDEVDALRAYHEVERKYSEQKLKKAKRNDYRDERGRFTKAPK